MQEHICLNILKQAKTLIPSEQYWTTKAYARTNERRTPISFMGEIKRAVQDMGLAKKDLGERVNPLDAKAERFSTMGSVKRAAHDLGYSQDDANRCRHYLKLAIERYCREHVERTPTSVEGFNDAPRRKYENVIKMLDYAIEIVESGGDEQNAHFIFNT